MLTTPSFGFDQMQFAVTKVIQNPSSTTFEEMASLYQKNPDIEALKQIFSLLTLKEKELMIEEQKEFLRTLKRRINIIAPEIELSTLNAIVKALPTNQQAKQNQELRMQTAVASKPTVWALDIDEKSWKKAEDHFKAKLSQFDVVASLLNRLESLKADVRNGVEKASIKSTLQAEITKSLNNIRDLIVKEFDASRVGFKKELEQTLETIKQESLETIEKASQQLLALEEPNEEDITSLKAFLAQGLKNADDILQSLIPVKYDRKDSNLAHSFIRVDGKVYAMAVHDYLGEGWYGKVKIAQDKSGRCFAVKIEGIDKTASNDNENNVAKLIGYFKGHALRSLDGVKSFKGRDAVEKTYTITELRKGKELFQHIYTNTLAAGHVYTKDEQDKKRKQGKEALTMVQKLLAGYQSCQVAEELHHRKVVHGDLKPANLMAVVLGNYVDVKPIDFGFSFQVDTDSKGNFTDVKADKAPNGTPLRYLPREIRVAHPGSKIFQLGEKATFSFASDRYSLGILFRDDLELPRSFYASLIRVSPNERGSLSAIKDRFIAALEKLPESKYDPEIKKIIYEHKQGVRRVHSVGPQTKSTYVGQLLSGFRDPQEVTGNPKSIAYTIGDYRAIAAAFYSLISPVKFFNDLHIEYLSASKTKATRQAYVHNARIFIGELLRADVKSEFLSKVEDGLDDFFHQLEPLDVDLLDMRSALQKEVSDAKKRKSAYNKTLVPSSVLPTPPENISSYLRENLVNNFNPHIEKHATRFASDLKGYQISLMKRIGLSEFHNNNFSKHVNKGGAKLPINECVDLFNTISERVATEILLAKNEKHQRRLFKFFTVAMDKSIALGDFQTAHALFGGLNFNTVSRLSFLRDDPAIIKMLNAAEKLFSSSFNFKAYRQHAKDRIVAGEDIVPYIGVLQRDLTFMVDGNPEKLASGKENEELMSLVGTAVQEQFMDLQDKWLVREQKPFQTNIASWLKQPRLVQDLDYFMSTKVMPTASSKPKYDETYAAIIHTIAHVVQLQAMNKEIRGEYELTTDPIQRRNLGSKLTAYQSYAKRYKEDLAVYAARPEFKEILIKLVDADSTATNVQELVRMAEEKLFGPFYEPLKDEQVNEDMAEEDFALFFSSLSLNNTNPSILRDPMLTDVQRKKKVVERKNLRFPATNYACQKEVDYSEDILAEAFRRKLVVT
ncbi:MAG: protein kinase [Gammaproteobacteria bacterium]|nr:protein kinase [Gammaproteobacteria bacterium]